MRYSIFAILDLTGTFVVTWKALGSVEVVYRACYLFLQIVFMKPVMN